MTALSSLSKLSFVELPKSAARDVIGYKRKRAAVRLQHLRELLKNPAYTRTVKRKGQEKAVRISPCWRSLPSGGFGVTLRLGGKLVEFAPGKVAVHAKAIDQV